MPSRLYHLQVDADPDRIKLEVVHLPPRAR